jgi:uncharacterized protein (TIGR03437 family)
MRTPLCICAALLSGQLLEAQVTLNPNPSRVIGQNSVAVASGSAPNLVEGREFSSPQSVTLDTTASPPILYVSDTGNNRVLAWQDATKAAAGVYADLVIGQRDKVSTSAQGPSASLRSGLYRPTGLVVDGQGNLYVVDSGNNRILRFPRPFDHTGDLQIPDLVIGQKSLDTNAPNSGGVSASTIATYLGGSTTPFRASLAFDASGNLYFTDAGNNRVLRYPASALGPGATNGPAADVVLGQPNMTTQDPLQKTPESVRNKAGLNAPGGLALDQRTNRLFVSDNVNPDAQHVVGRVLVYPFPLQSGMSASRIMGVASTVDAVFYGPEGITMLGSNPAVFDFGYNRILIFDPIDQWPTEDKAFSPQAKWVLGQPDMSTGKANAGSKGFSGPVQGFFFNNELYVADAGNNRVIVFPQQPASPTPSGGAVRVVGQLNFDGNSVNLIEGKELYLNIPLLAAQAGIAVDQKSDPPHLYIADTFNSRILGYRDARRIKNGATADLVIGQPDLFRSLVNYHPFSDAGQPSDSGGLRLPTGLAVDANGNLFVADFGNARVLRFPSPFNQSGMQRPNLVLGQSSFTIRVTDASARTMAAPYGVAITPEGHLLVSDAAHNRVLLFTRPTGGDFANGQAASAHFGQPDFISIQGSGTPAPANRMNGPRGIAVDSSARLYVCDTGNNRVLIYDQASTKGPNDDPNPAPPGLTGLRSPYGVEVSQATGEIWVTDTANTSNPRVVRYRSFEQLPVDNYQPTYAVRANVPLAAALDGFGNLFVAEATNRVAIYYPAMVPVNAANYVVSTTRALSPGVIATLYPLGGTLAPEEKTFTDLPNPIPVPKTLGDVQLLFNDTPAPLYYVGPRQINFLVPMSAPTSGTADLVLQRASTGQILAAGLMQMGEASPALFTANASGSGQVAALNQDNSVNSPTNAAARNEVIQLFGTGQGFVSGAPADGELATGLVPTSEKPAVWIEGSTDDRGGYVPPDYIQYSGLAPSLVGVWQINVKIPEKTAPGSRIIFVSLKSIASSPPQTRISVK